MITKCIEKLRLHNSVTISMVNKFPIQFIAFALITDQKTYIE